MLAPDLAALLVGIASVLLVLAVLGSTCLTARTEHIARSIGADVWVNA